MAAEEPEIMEVDKKTTSEGKITTQKSQKTAAHELPWYAGNTCVLIV